MSTCLPIYERFQQTIDFILSIYSVNPIISCCFDHLIHFRTSFSPNNSIFSRWIHKICIYNFCLQHQNRKSFPIPSFEFYPFLHLHSPSLIWYFYRFLIHFHVPTLIRNILCTDSCYPYTALQFGGVRFNVTGLATFVTHIVIVCWRMVTCMYRWSRNVTTPRWCVFNHWDCWYNPVLIPYSIHWTWMLVQMQCQPYYWHRLTHWLTQCSWLRHNRSLCHRRYRSYTFSPTGTVIVPHSFLYHICELIQLTNCTLFRVKSLFKDFLPQQLL